MEAETASAPDTQPLALAANSDAAHPQGFRGNWKPVLLILFLSPAIGELLSGSSPPLQFFNPILLALLVGLYGCGALLIREIAVRRGLNAVGVALLGAAYAIAEEGLTCKSFFNPNWTDAGLLGSYGRALGVNWVWSIGLTVYHAVVSITVPIFLAEACFPGRSRLPWLRRRGWFFASAGFVVVIVLGFAAFDNREFHLLEVEQPAALADKVLHKTDPVAEFVHSQMTPKDLALLQKPGLAAEGHKLRRLLTDNLNRLLKRADLHNHERFQSVTLTEDIRTRIAARPRDDQLVALNRLLLESAFPGELARRQAYPFRLSVLETLGCLAAMLGLAWWAFRQVRTPTAPSAAEGQESPATQPARLRAWLPGVGFTLGFCVVGFLIPGLLESGTHIPPFVPVLAWLGFALLTWRMLRRIDRWPGRLWRRGLWALGVTTPFIFTSLFLGLVVQVIGTESFWGMPVISFLAAALVVWLGLKWKRCARAVKVQA